MDELFGCYKKIRASWIVTYLFVFLFGVLISSIVWRELYLEKCVQIIGMASESLSSEEIVPLVNQVMNNNTHEEYDKGKTVLEKLGYKYAYSSLLMDGFNLMLYIFLFVFCGVGMSCFVLCKIEKYRIKEQYLDFSSWAEDINAKKKDFSFIPAIIIESVIDLKHQIERLSIIQKEDNNRLINYLEDISHQLKTPLAVIRAICERLLIVNDSSHESEMKCCLSQVDTMTEMIQQLLLLGRFECGKIKANFSMVAPTDLMEIISNDYVFLLKEKEISLEIEGSSDSEWYCDEFWIRQILNNVITNAINNGTVGGKIKISYSTSDTMNHIIVWDDGIGFENGIEHTIFDRYSSKDRTGKEGAGLGMAIAKQAIELHFGSIQATNHFPHGAEFRISFPKLDSNSIYGKK